MRNRKGCHDFFIYLHSALFTATVAPNMTANITHYLQSSVLSNYSLSFPTDKKTHFVVIVY